MTKTLEYIFNYINQHDENTITDFGKTCCDACAHNKLQNLIDNGKYLADMFISKQSISNMIEELLEEGSSNTHVIINGKTKQIIDETTKKYGIIFKKFNYIVKIKHDRLSIVIDVNDMETDFISTWRSTSS